MCEMCEVNHSGTWNETLSAPTHYILFLYSVCQLVRNVRNLTAKLCHCVLFNLNCFCDQIWYLIVGFLPVMYLLICVCINVCMYQCMYVYVVLYCIFYILYYIILYYIILYYIILYYIILYYIILYYIILYYIGTKLTAKIIVNTTLVMCHLKYFPSFLF